ncbi:hypothetical protein GJ496_001073, partial [Pomphorhynchus laevis]
MHLHDENTFITVDFMVGDNYVRITCKSSGNFCCLESQTEIAEIQKLLINRMYEFKVVYNLLNRERTRSTLQSSQLKSFEKWMVSKQTLLANDNRHSNNVSYEKIYSCVHCDRLLAKHEDIISKSFQGSHGRAYLFNTVVNIGTKISEKRFLLTGLHEVSDIYCKGCNAEIGWKYV